MTQAMKVTYYLGERDRVGRDFTADVILGRCAEIGVAVSVMFRGMEGFGRKHHLRTDSTLTLSEDLPAVIAAVDEPAVIDRLLQALHGLPAIGLITVERSQLLTTADSSTDLIPAPLGLAGSAAGAVRLTVLTGRGHRVDGRPAYQDAVQVLREHGVAGATVLLGVDGTVGGRRARAGFLSRNTDVPTMVLAVGDAPQITGALTDLHARLDAPQCTVERVTILKRDGQRWHELPDLAAADAAGRPWQHKISVFTSEDTLVDGRPLHRALTRALRRAGGTGSTTLPGVYGYAGDTPPAQDRWWPIARHVPTVTATINDAATTTALLPVIDRLTEHHGLVTIEHIPATGTTGDRALDLADPPPSPTR